MVAFPSIEPINPKIYPGDFIKYTLHVSEVVLDAENKRPNNHRSKNVIKCPG
jgi:hypothetical protein